MPPYRIFPVVIGLAFFQHQFLVYVYAKSRQLRQIYIAVGKLEIIFVIYIIQHALAYIVMNAHTLLLNDRIVAGGVYVQAACQCNGAKGAVGSQGNVIGFCHRADFLYLGDTAGMA